MLASLNIYVIYVSLKMSIKVLIFLNNGHTCACFVSKLVNMIRFEGLDLSTELKQIKHVRG